MNSPCWISYLEFQEASLALETKTDEVATLNTQLEVAKEKLEANRVQTEEK